MITCPHCKRKTHEGQHCEKCGGVLVAAAGATTRAFDEMPTTRDPIADTPFSDNPTILAKPVSRPAFDANSFGSRLDDRIDAETQKIDEKIERATMGAGAASAGSAPRSGSTDRIALYVDRLSILYENIIGSVRFRLAVPHGTVLRDVTLKFTNKLLATLFEEQYAQVDAATDQLPVGFPKMEAGSYVWKVELSFVRDRMRHVMTSSFELLVLRPENSRAIAEQLVFNIHNDIKAEGAADVHVSNRIADELKGVLNRGEDPFRVLQRVVCGRDRAWCQMKLYDVEDRSKLPPCPQAAKTDCLKLNFGYRIIRLCANRMVSFGRNRDRDFIVRPAENCSEEDKIPYHSMSRRQCFFEHDGDRIVIHDGQRLSVAATEPSSFGTFVDNRNIGECGMASLSVGESSILSFGGISYDNVVSLDARACSPEFACAKCPYADKQWCGAGRPSLVLSRRDGISETFVCLWSCLHLGEIDRSFDGVVIFRKEGAFAWFRGSECGWLVPGMSLETDYGTVEVTTGAEDKKKPEHKVGG